MTDELPLEISTAETAEALAQDDAVVVDVREPYEREAGHIPGTRHIAMGDLSSQAATLPADRPIVFYCRVGGRSAMAAQAFRASGYAARSMAGGIVAWHGEGRALDPDGGTVADH